MIMCRIVVENISPYTSWQVLIKLETIAVACDDTISAGFEGLRKNGWASSAHRRIL
jgi:hypothetical protein